MSDVENAQDAPAGDQEKQEKTMAERAQEVGRDGAYLECDARDLVRALRNGDLQRSVIVVVTSARIELSAPSDVGGLAKATQDVVDKVASHAGTTGDSEYAGLSDEQASLLVLRKLLSAGMAKGIG